MTLYHTSDRIIQRPDVHQGRKNADFGWGFYLSPDRDFTYRWARDSAVVNAYEFDESGLEVRRFTRSAEWFEYIFHNRRLRDGLKADVVIGPIANDTIFDTLGLITSGYLTTDQALRLLMIRPEYTQVAVKTERAAQRLRWMSAERISLPEAGALKRERDAYQELFAKELAALTGAGEDRAQGDPGV